MKNFYSTLLLSLFTVLLTQAQQTGSFNEELTFNNEQRTLSYFVPNDYDANKKYALMVCLHGLGDNSGNFRSAIINSLNWDTDFTNTIFIFPDGGSDQNKDFYNPAGDEAFIDQAITHAFDNYNIDSSNLLLEGFSLGARSALKYGLERDGFFKGLVLNTPAMQGIKDANNDPTVSLDYDFQNAANIPVYITLGQNDQTYVNSVDTLFRNLVLENGMVRINRIPGMGHRVPSFSQMNDVTEFLNSPAFDGNDASLVSAFVSGTSCSSNQTIEILLRNQADKSLTEVEFNIEINDVLSNYTWNGNLDSFQHERAQIPLSFSTQGYKEVILEVASVNGQQIDEDPSNNELNVETFYQLTSAEVPVKESFENSFGTSDAGWLFDVSGEVVGLNLDDETAIDGDFSLASINTILLFDNLGKEEAIVSPAFDLSGFEDPKLHLSYAYNFHRFTTQIFPQEVDFADTLVIYASTDCGNTWEEVFREGGEELSTFDEPIIDPIQIANAIQNPAEEDWGEISLDLDDYTNESSVKFRIAYQSGLGGFIYMDNFRIDATQSVKPKSNSFASSVFPNPFSNQIEIKSDEPIDQISIYSTSGREVFKQNYNGQENLNLNTANFKSGIYFVNLKSADQSIRFKLVKN